MNRRWISLGLALLFIFTTGCIRPTAPDPEITPPAASGQAEPEKSASQDVSAQEELPLLWTEQPFLSPQQLPENHNGLELPIQGATGYTSIELPLWQEREDLDAALEEMEQWQQAKEQRTQERMEWAEAMKNYQMWLQAQREQQPSQTPEMELPVQTPETEPLPSDGLQELPLTQEVPLAEDVPLPQEPTPEEGEPLPEQTETLFPGQEGEQTFTDPNAPPLPPTAEPPPPLEEEIPEPQLSDFALAMLPPGTAFTVLREEGNWWQISCQAPAPLAGELVGWLEHRYCMVNLPDVIPSMIYDATNSYSSRFVSCGKPLEGITGEALYPTATENLRLGEEEFMMPVLYSMAFRLCAAQRSALEQGNCLVLYEGYRPHEVQRKVGAALTAALRKDPEIRAAVTEAPWNISWFIATGYSNHQHGYAVDISVARLDSVRECSSGGYRYIRAQEYRLYDMPTPIHELSRAAATFTRPVATHSDSAWRTATLADTMTDTALGLQRYCTDAGLTPLASEWWHFNDLYTRAFVVDQQGTGDFVIRSCRSAPPQ